MQLTLIVVTVVLATVVAVGVAGVLIDRSRTRDEPLR